MRLAANWKQQPGRVRLSRPRRPGPAKPDMGVFREEARTVKGQAACSEPAVGGRERRTLGTTANKVIEANRRLRLLEDKPCSRGTPNAVEVPCAGGGVLVDIGCGSGTFFGQVHDRYDLLVGIDFIPLARSDFDNAYFLRADLSYGIPLVDRVADTVTAIEVIEHMADPLLFVREAFRILKPGGEFILTTPNVRYVRQVFRLIVRGQGPKTAGCADHELLWDGGHIHYFTSKDLVVLLRGVGFVSVRSMALIRPEGFLPVIRRLLACWPSNVLVREFLTGRLLVVGMRPRKASA